MAEDVTLTQMANKERWCFEQVPEGQEDWPQGETAWHPLRGYCKGRGKEKVDGTWRCKKHLPVKH